MIQSCAAIVIAAKHHELTKIKDTRGTTHTVGALRCRFEFRTSDWDYSAKTAMFCNGDAILHPEVANSAIAVPLDEDNECAVPYEMLTDTLPYSIGVWGAIEDGLRIVSRWLVFGAQPGCYSDGNAPADPEPTIYEQILTTSQSAVNTANKVLNMANNGEFDGEDGVSIIKSEINNKGELVLTYSNEQSSNLGRVVGVNGINGVDGTTIAVNVSSDDKISAEVKAGSIKGGHIASDAAISKGKLAADVQASLEKADSALQSHQDISHLATVEALNSAKNELSVAIASAKTEAANQDAVVLAEAQNYANTAKADAIADAATKYETIGTAQGIVDGLKLAETYESIGAEGRAIAAAKTETETQVSALAETVYTKSEVDALVAAAHTWGEF